MPPHETWWTSAEAGRHRAFLRPERRRRYLAGRWLLRWLLGETTGQHPSGLPMAGEGAPQSLSAPGWTLSLSHSADWLAAVVSNAGPVGVDIELAAPLRNWRALASFIGLADVTDEAEFYRHWTLSEAWLKAHERDLPDAAGLRWSSELAGPGWQAQDVALGLHVACWSSTPSALSDLRWLSWPNVHAPEWSGVSRWTQSTPKSK